MKIKIDTANQAKIEAALALVRGRAKAHCYTSYAEVEKAARRLDLRIAKLPKYLRVGAEMRSTSGDSVPGAYKYARRATEVRLIHTRSGIYLTGIAKVKVFTQGGGERVCITEDAREWLRREAVKRFGQI